VQLKGKCFLTLAIANLMCTCNSIKVLVLVLEAGVLDTSLGCSVFIVQFVLHTAGIIGI